VLTLSNGVIVEIYDAVTCEPIRIVHYDEEGNDRDLFGEQYGEFTIVREE